MSVRENPCGAVPDDTNVEELRLPSLRDDPSQTHGGVAMLTSPQRLPTDRVLAARASAAALAASAVRVGYVAAAVARAGGHKGYSRHPQAVQLGTGQSSSSRDGCVATAAVR